MSAFLDNVGTFVRSFQNTRVLEGSIDKYASLKDRTQRDSDPALLVQRVTLIGPFYNRWRGLFNPAKGLFWRDAWTLRNALDHVEDIGFSLAPKIQVAIKQLIYGSDFLDQNRVSPADLVVSSFVYHPGDHVNAEEELELWNPLYAKLFPGNSNLSQHHFEKGAWYDAARDSGAKAVVAFCKPYNSDEIRARHFFGSSFIQRKPVGVSMQAHEKGKSGTFLIETLVRRDVNSLLNQHKSSELAL